MAISDQCIRLRVSSFVHVHAHLTRSSRWIAHEQSRRNQYIRFYQVAFRKNVPRKSLYLFRVVLLTQFGSNYCSLLVSSVADISKAKVNHYNAEEIIPSQFIIPGSS